MEEIWQNIASTYGNAQDLEEMNRCLIAEAAIRIASARVGAEPVKILELGCGNGKVLKKCLSVASESCRITGVDSSSRMLSVARETLLSSPYISLIEADILAWSKACSAEQYDMVFAANTLHNLPSDAAIVETIQDMVRLAKPGGLVVFDVRNAWNPFLSYGYWKNRRAGMQFFTFSPFRAVRLLRQAGCEVTMLKPLAYTTIAEAGKQSKPRWFKFLYRWYLRQTQRVRFALYVHIEAKKI